MITTEAVYNVYGKTIKRKIPISSIYAVTLSKKSSEFVLHVPSEYDYRFDSKKLPEVRDHLL